MQIKKSVTDFAKSLDKPSDEKINAHEGVFYLIGPGGDFRKAFGHDEDSQKIALAVSPQHSAPQMLLSLYSNLIRAYLSITAICLCDSILASRRTLM